jgi:hypothetical protein
MSSARGIGVSGSRNAKSQLSTLLDSLEKRAYPGMGDASGFGSCELMSDFTSARTIPMDISLPGLDQAFAIRENFRRLCYLEHEQYSMSVQINFAYAEFGSAYELYSNVSKNDIN